MTKLRVFTIRAILDSKQQQQHGNTGNGTDKLSYTTTTLIYITTTDKHGVPPTKRLFRVAMLDPSQGFIDPWGKFGDLELPNKNHICNLGDYSKPSHEGYRNAIELPKGNNVVSLRSDTIGSQDLWDHIENDVQSSNEAQTKEYEKKDAKALFFIQQAVDESIFSRIASATTAKQAWTILSTEYQGSSKVITVKLQSLRREFETSSMKSNEPVKDFLARVSTVVSHMKSYAAIEESKDLSKFSFDELMGSLQAHEAQINRSNLKNEEKAFQIKGEHDYSSQRGRGRARVGYRGREAKYVEEEEDDDNFLFMTMGTEKQEKSDPWYVDSGCSHHMTGDRTKFKGLDEAFKSQVRLGDNKQLRIKGQGTTEISIGNKKKFIQDVCYAPCLAHNLLSVGQLMETGHSLLFDDGKCVVKHKATESELWHQRYGHLYVQGLQLLQSKDMVSGLPTIKLLEKTCEGCMVGKQAKQSFPTGKSKRAERVLELFHADLCGPMRTESLKFKALVEKQSGRNIKVLRTDCGGEFLSKEFNDFCDEHGILRQLTALYTLEQNGVAERKNRTIVEMTRCMLKQKGMRDSFWADCVATTVYIINISPVKFVWEQTPYKAWSSNKPSGRGYRGDGEVGIGEGELGSVLGIVVLQENSGRGGLRFWRQGVSTVYG
ncbi:retrovirus-related pol polyprotein from transposon TNT 1-94 [Tanacetum coccineum]